MAYTFESVIALVLPFIIGLLIGYILKQSIKILAALVVLILILLFTGAISVDFVSFFFKNIFMYGTRALEAAKSVSSVLPFSSILFVIGVAIGFLLSK